MSSAAIVIGALRVKSILEAKWVNTGNLILTQVYDTYVILYDTYELYLKEIYILIKVAYSVTMNIFRKILFSF